MNETLSKILGLKVIKAVSGGGAGSILRIDFDDTTYLMIYSEWRIEKNNKVIVTSYDSIDPDTGLIPKKIQELLGNEVENVELTPQKDLILKFSDDYVLKVFSLVSYSDTSYIGHSWEYNLPKNNLSLVVTREFELITEKYE